METVTTNSRVRVRHPVFARVYPRVATWADAHGSAEHRGELLEGVHGRVIEVGAGHGANFRRYPPEVTEVIAVEPEPRLRELAQAATARASVPITVVQGTAEGLPAGDAEFDAAVASLVLCSVHDPAQALAEVQRVLRPGGELRFYEHLRSHHAGLARYQRVVDSFWPYLAGGCHVDRPTADTIEAAGFTMDKLRHFRFPPSRIPSASSPCIIGLARRP